jgi:CBS domain-containing protein
MTPEVKAVSREDSLLQVMEALSIYRFGAILVTDKKNRPCGVISKTDLTLAYKHGVDAHVAAETIMSSPVQCCGADELLEDAIRKMIFTDIHRLFVHGPDPEQLAGVFSLSDAARIRSGSCHACVSSRIQIDA